VRNGGHYEGNNFPFSVFRLTLFIPYVHLCVSFLLVAITFETGTRQQKTPLTIEKTGHRNESAATKATQQCP
jgi:hypothetical protein